MSHLGYLRDQQLRAHQGHAGEGDTMSSFTTPAAPSGGIDFEAHKGALLVVDVLGVEAGIKTSFGEKTAVRANVAVIDGPGSPETYDDCLLFPTVLVSQTKNSVGQKVLGRLGQGNAKPGQKPPWLLEEANPTDLAKGEAWVTQNAKPQVTSAEAPF